YFTKPQVGYTVPCTSTTCNPNRVITPPLGSDTSPLVGTVSYYPWQDWSINGNIAYNPSNHYLDNGNVSISFNKESHFIATFGYQYVKDIAGIDLNTLGLSGNTNTLYVGTAIPITHKWSIMGYWNYAFAQDR